MFEVTGTEWTIRDAQGNALCHSERQTKDACNARRRRAVIGAWEQAMRHAGIMTGTRVLCVDGIERDRGHGEDERDGYADAAHIVADSLDGAFCGCNLVPLEGATNRADGDARPMVDTSWPADAYAAAWRVVALQTMPKTRARRAV
jgi:hypothetical protein